MTLDTPCAGSALLRFPYVASADRASLLRLAGCWLALLKRIDAERPRFLNCFLLMNVFRSGLDALGAFYKIRLRTFSVSVDSLTKAVRNCTLAYVAILTWNAAIRVRSNERTY